MPDPFATSTALLERLLQQIKTETDPVKVDQLAAELWRVLGERERLQNALALKNELDQKETPASES